MSKAKSPNLVVASTLVAFLPAIAFGEAVSLPERQPAAPSPITVDPTAVTGSVPQRVSLLSDGGFSDFGNATVLKSGLEALRAGDIARAQKIRDGLSQKSLDRHILAWVLAMDGGVSSGEIEAIRQGMAGWPGAVTLKRNLERAMVRESADPESLVAAFTQTAPETLEGSIALARAQTKLGNKEAARDALAPRWRKDKLDASAEVRIIKEFGDVLTAADHRARMERMFYAERPRAAERVAELGGAPALAKAWAAVLRGDKTARALLDAVPAEQRGAGFVFAEAKYLRRTEKIAEAAAAMLKAPREAELLIDPDEWWVERRVLSRELVDIGDVKTAYQLAAAHSAESPLNAADAEFHAGWYALRGLRDPATAARHFQRIAEIAEGPITLARAYYWLGRAAEEGGPGDAKAFYARAATYGTAFYGQLAAVKTGAAITVTSPEPSDADRQAFARREPIKAIERLEIAGDTTRAALLYREMAQQLTSPGEIALLADMAARRGDHHLALRVGKLAAARGIDVGALSHPVGAIPASADISGAGKALAYAIARQESEFNVGAVSGAGALGLLQLLPGTAQEVAKKTGLDYSKPRLTEDAGYNATLGAAFLNEQLSRFAGSYVLTFAGYNAGPRRAQEWVKRYGDPRGKDLDTVVDWIERIPFTETRGYVQRVMENYQVYKAQLSGKFDIADDLVKGR